MKTKFTYTYDVTDQCVLFRYNHKKECFVWCKVLGAWEKTVEQKRLKFEEDISERKAKQQFPEAFK